MDLADAALLRVAEREGLCKSSLSTAAISRSTVSTIVRAPRSVHNSQSQGPSCSSHGLHSGDQFWNVNFDERALAGAALDLQMKVGAVEDAEAFADVAQADALDIDVRHFFFGDTHAVVFDFYAQAAVAICGAQLDFSAVELGREAVFQAIFDDGLEKHAGNEGFEGFFVNLLDNIEVVAAEAGHFDIEIVVDEFEFFA